jgi:hypothetical protein
MPQYLLINYDDISRPPHPPTVLLSKLRITLSCLYDGSNNNSSITHHNNGVSVKEAHDFLLRFKSRNICCGCHIIQIAFHGKIGLPTTPTTITTITTMTDKKKMMK